MTDITITKQGNSVTEVVASGHTGYGYEGEDIVCAGISTLIQTAALGLLRVVKINIKYTVDEKTETIRIALPQNLTPAERHDADTVLDTMLLGLYDFYSEYSDYIKLEVK